MSARVVDPRRLLRALRLEVEPLGPGRYLVTGGSEPRVVLVRGGGWVCNCPDAAFRPSVRCAHVIAAYLTRKLAPPVRLALRSVTAPGQQVSR